MRVLLFSLLLLPYITSAQTTYTVTDQTWKCCREANYCLFRYWTQPNQPDSWPYAVVVPDNCLHPSNGDILPVSGVPAAYCIWAQNTNNQCSQSDNDIVYFRKFFTLPSPLPPPTTCHYYIKIKADNEATVYINGTLAGSVSNNQFTDGQVFDITSSVVGGNNLVAVRAKDFGIVGMISARVYNVCN